MLPWCVMSPFKYFWFYLFGYLCFNCLKSLALLFVRVDYLNPQINKKVCRISTIECCVEFVVVPIILGHLMQMFVWHVRVIQGLLSETRINHGRSLKQQRLYWLFGCCNCERLTLWKFERVILLSRWLQLLYVFVFLSERFVADTFGITSE